MKRNLILVAVVAAAIAATALSPLLLKMVYAKQPESTAAQASTANKATVDITINDRGGLSVGGVDLNSLGVSALDQQVVTTVKSLQSVHVTVQDKQVNVAVQNTPLMQMDWNQSSRQASANLAVRYGVQLTPQFQSRLEEWISSSDIDVTARYANELSKVADIALTKPVQVDLAQNGQLTVETLPLAAQIDPSVVQSLMMGGSQATACWSKGKLTAAVDGAQLPTITLNPEGVEVLNQALNLNITNIKAPLLAARFGVDLSLPGGAHVATAACNE